MDLLLAVVIVVVVALAAYCAYRMYSKKDKFSGDLDGWPSASVVGALAYTNPYGNYAGHA